MARQFLSTLPTRVHSSSAFISKSDSNWSQYRYISCSSYCSACVCSCVHIEMSKHYNQKASLEQELPTTTQKLFTTTECLLGSLGSLTNSTGKVRPIGGDQQPGSRLISRACNTLCLLMQSRFDSSWCHDAKLPL